YYSTNPSKVLVDQAFAFTPDNAPFSFAERRLQVPERDIIVVGGSAGALEALSPIVAKLPHALAAPVFVGLHSSPTSNSMLPQILTRAGRLEAIQATDKQPIEKSLIYLAPPDRHLMLENSHVTIVHGPKENRSRPAVDPLFRSAALNYGP